MTATSDRRGRSCSERCSDGGGARGEANLSEKLLRPQGMMGWMAANVRSLWSKSEASQCSGACCHDYQKQLIKSVLFIGAVIRLLQPTTAQLNMTPDDQKEISKISRIRILGVSSVSLLLCRRSESSGFSTITTGRLLLSTPLSEQVTSPPPLSPSLVPPVPRPPSVLQK